MPVTINGSDGITNALWTTGTRPSNPAAGQMGFNSETEVLEFYNASLDEWRPVTFSTLSATGGSVSDVTMGGQEFRVHEFTSGGTFEIISGTDAVDILIVAGGGGGGGDGGGGGGAGGVILGNINVNPGSYTIDVGNGGAGRLPPDRGDNGQNTTAFGLTALGGGGGASHTGNSGGDGGSGGGGARDISGGSGLQPGSTDGGFGNNGANGGSSRAAGGGGADAPGNSGDSNGDGGAGKDFSSIFTTSFGENGFFGGGGGGGHGDSSSSFGDGGIGGGGDSPASDGQPGQANTGGGGAGGSGSSSHSGGDGGSGIVLIRYRIG